MKTMTALMIILSSLVLNTVVAAEPNQSRDQETTLSTTALGSDNTPTGASTECKAVCALPTARVARL